MTLICHVILQDGVMKGECDFLGRNLLGTHLNSGDVMILVCHVIFRDNAIKALCDFVVMSSSA